MQIPKKSERLKFFQDLYETAKSKSPVYDEALERNLKQYKGSKDIDGSNEPADVVRNITYELIESQITSYIPTARVDPLKADEKSTRCARSIETLISSVKNQLPFEEMNDIDERYTYIYGGSIWLAEWDESIISGHGSVGGVRVSCISPRHFVGQPGINNVADMEYCFIKFETTKEEICRRYNVEWKDAEETESDEGTVTEETATLYVCYYKNDADKICQFVWSADVTLSDVDDYYSRKREYCVRCHKKRQVCECDEPKIKLMNEEYNELERDVVTSYGVIPAMSVKMKDGIPVTEEVEVPVLDEAGNQVMTVLEGGLIMPATQKVEVPKMEKTKLPFYTPKTFPIVIRKNTSQEDSLLGQSDCEFIRDQQQAINKVETRIMQKLMRSGITPVMPEGATVTLNNSVFGNVIKMKPGETAAQYGKIDTTPDISKDIAEAERLYQQAKNTLGITDSYQGQADTTAKSGIAKQAQIAQAAGRLDSKRKMKNFAYSQLFRIIFENYLAYADEPRPAVYKDVFGRAKETTFNRNDFYERDEAGEWYVNDEFLFSADSSTDYNQDRTALWQENRLNFKEGAYGDPVLPETQLSFWLNMEKLHYPFAYDQVLRLTEIVNMQRQIAAQQQIIAEKDEQIKRDNAAIVDKNAELDVLRKRENERNMMR
jgi:hypothetical protein